MVLDIRDMKVERLEKKLDLLSKTGSFFDRSTLRARTSRTIYVPEFIYTSLESPNMQFFGAPMIEGVALQTNLPHPF